MKHKKIALIGMMGCGKSTVSKELANKLNFNLFELDEIFEQQENIKIKDYFNKYGENNFRKIETKILNEIIKKENIIISCGGGIILSKENRDMLFNTNIITVYLKTSIDEIFSRIKNDKTRPLLQVENPKEEIKKILSAREMFYKKADLTILTNNKTPEEITNEILEAIWKK